MILRWMTDGEIEDEHGDFFIAENLSESDWNNSHTLRFNFIKSHESYSKINFYNLH